MTASPENDRLSLFEGWAAEYDGDVEPGTGFPFAGYQDVLRAVVEAAASSPGTSVLDVGTGTGKLAKLFAGRTCTVTGIDFSEAMLSIARERVPSGEFLQVDLMNSWNAIEDRRFDVITSAYVFHEFDLATKADVIARLARDHLLLHGRIVIADIAFESVADRETAHRQWRDVWDEDEHYWAADEVMPVLAEHGFSVSYRQISDCAGVFVIR